MLLALALVAALVAGAAPGGVRPVRATSHGVEVTSSSGAEGGAVCPHESLCTLRQAIETANDDTDSGLFTITFDPEIFPEDAPVTISIAGAPLPNISRNDVAIDASGAGVALTGDFGSLSAVFNGLTVTGDGFVLRGISIHGFTGSCVAVTGADAVIGGPSAAQGNVFGGCQSGIAIAGADAVVQGNLVGFTPAGAEDPVDTGIVIAAGGALIGGPAISPEASNRIGFADTAIFVGAGAGDAFTGVTIERNNIGARPTGEAAPVGTGVVIAQPSSATAILANTFENATTGITVRPDQDGLTSVRNRFVANTFENIAGMAIDLGADGVRNPNDPGDEDTGPNAFLNHPLITRATQTQLLGTACPGCAIQVYVSEHEPGGIEDYGRIPLPGGTTTADGAGQFLLGNPAAAPGDWLVALATDADGNTSEFGPPSRVGAGAVLCGNVQLQAGWNHVAYFGNEPVALFGTFPPDPAGAVTAIYRYVDGAGEWERWFSSTAAGRTLNAVQPGQAYWFFATQPVTLPGGFSISFPVPVELAAGWNDFVYLGASAHPLDALASLGPFDSLYRYDAALGRWLRWGDAAVPAWAQDFSTLEACATYMVRLSEPRTLLPLQP
jgi:hypothetical protein